MSRVTNIYKSFTYNMTAKTSRRRYETKLRHCHPVRYNIRRGVDNCVSQSPVLRVTADNTGHDHAVESARTTTTAQLQLSGRHAVVGRVRQHHATPV